ncbi:MAG: glycosyltransferase [Gemmatimonadota bacterium]
MPLTLENRPARVAFVVNNTSFGGDERTVLHLVSGLPRGSYEVAVACSLGGALVDRLHDMGVPVLAWAAGQRPRFSAPFSLAREFKRYRPDIVHGLGGGELLARIAARLARVPIIVSSGAALVGVGEGFGWTRGQQRLLGRATAGFVERYVALNRASADALTDRYRVAPSRVVVIPNGIEIERFDPTQARRGVWRARFGVPDGAVLVGGIGRLSPEKGFRDLLRAFASEESDEVWLVIAGDGPDWEELQALVEVFGLKDRVLLPGFVKDVPELLADIDIFVLPSLVENHPLVLLEAMAMARPVVAADISGVGDTVDDGVDGRLVAAGDVPALAEAIRMFIREPAAARRCGRNARRKIEREYTVERMVRRTAVLYQELLSGKAGGGFASRLGVRRAIDWTPGATPTP